MVHIHIDFMFYARIYLLKCDIQICVLLTPTTTCTWITVNKTVRKKTAPQKTCPKYYYFLGSNTFARQDSDILSYDVNYSFPMECQVGLCWSKILRFENIFVLINVKLLKIINP